MIDKSFADGMLHTFQHDEGYRLYYRGCPCCDSQDDCRRPVNNHVIRFLYSGMPSPMTQEWFENFFCAGCGSYFTALFRGNRLVGFSEELPPNPFVPSS